MNFRFSTALLTTLSFVPTHGQTFNLEIPTFDNSTDTTTNNNNNDEAPICPPGETLYTFISSKGQLFEKDRVVIARVDDEKVLHVTDLFASNFTPRTDSDTLGPSTHDGCLPKYQCYIMYFGLDMEDLRLFQDNMSIPWGFLDFDRSKDWPRSIFMFGEGCDLECEDDEALVDFRAIDHGSNKWWIQEETKSQAILAKCDNGADDCSALQVVGMSGDDSLPDLVRDNPLYWHQVCIPRDPCSRFILVGDSSPRLQVRLDGELAISTSDYERLFYSELLDKDCKATTICDTASESMLEVYTEGDQYYNGSISMFYGTKDNMAELEMKAKVDNFRYFLECVPRDACSMWQIQADDDCSRDCSRQKRYVVKADGIILGTGKRYYNNLPKSGLVDLTGNCTRKDFCEDDESLVSIDYQSSQPSSSDWRAQTYGKHGKKKELERWNYDWLRSGPVEAKYMFCMKTDTCADVQGYIGGSSNQMGNVSVNGVERKYETVGTGYGWYGWDDDWYGDYDAEVMWILDGDDCAREMYPKTGNIIVGVVYGVALLLIIVGFVYLAKKEKENAKKIEVEANTAAAKNVPSPSE